jgi:mannose-6-phosphate isomerase-like protein (cupin superfamily)
VTASPGSSIGRADATAALQPVALRDKLARFADHWAPRVVAELNDYQVKLVKLQGDFVWHRHDDTDEMFLVIEGEMEIAFRDATVRLREGDLFVVPRGREHITRAKRECHALIIEPRGVANTGDAGGRLTAPQDAWV